ncbi:uncharacterized protein LOC121392032 [Gigantopelta aegis]|uniref:uncharacterized protein LOC121392032 n=1 Tax=Gigantopelta aegis TaxID=1735272 RepID=UPI001B88BE72|nr:uncharacterized protein LOC121392032 [Gigantopelta aegis]
MKRKNRFCFQSDKMDSPRRTASPIHATSSVPNNYEQYNADVTNRVQYENVAYCAQPNTKALRGPIAVSSIDYDLAAADDTLQGPRHLADLPNGIRPRDDYELAGPDDGAADLTGDLYNTTEPTPHGRTDSETYNHIKGDRFEDEDMYNHTDGSDDLPEQYDPEYSHITTK